MCKTIHVLVFFQVFGASILKKEFNSFIFPMSTNNILTRSKTSENSGVLLVFNGRAGFLFSCSSVRGGTCLMK